MADTPFPLPRATRQTDVLEGDGTTTVFGPFAFKIFDIEDVEVQTRLDGATFFSPASVTVAKTTADAFSHFTVTFAVAPAATTEFLVLGRREPMRQLAVTKGGSIAGAELEKELSKQAVALSEYRRDLDRTLVADFGDTDAPRTVAIGAGVEGAPLLLKADRWEVGGESYDALRGRVTSAEAINATQNGEIDTLQDQVLALQAGVVGDTMVPALRSRISDSINLLDYATTAAARTALKNGSVGIKAAWDDASADAAARGIGTIDIPAGNFELDTDQTLTLDRNVRGQPGATRLYKNGVGRFFQAHGTKPSTSYPLAADASKGATSVPLSAADAANFTADTTAVIRSNAITYGSSSRDAEFVHILDVNTDTGVITFEAPLFFSYATADSAALYILPPLLEGIGAENLIIDCADAAQTTPQRPPYYVDEVFSLYFCRNPRLINIATKNTIMPTVTLHGCMDAYINLLRGKNGLSDGTDLTDAYSYGIQEVGLNVGLIAGDLYFERHRHGYTTGVADSTDAVMFNGGHPMFSIIGPGTHRWAKEAGWDTHGTGIDPTLNYLKTIGGRRSGFQLRCFGATLNGCEAYDIEAVAGANGDGLWAVGGSSDLRARDIKVNGFTARNCDGAGILDQSVGTLRLSGAIDIRGTNEPGILGTNASGGDIVVNGDIFMRDVAKSPSFSLTYAVAVGHANQAFAQIKNLTVEDPNDNLTALVRRAATATTLEIHDARGRDSTGASIPTFSAFSNSTGISVWPKPKELVSTGSPGNVGSGEDDLASLTVPAGAMYKSGTGFRVTAWGTFANNANAKTLKAYLGASAVLTTSLATSVAGVWHCQIDVLYNISNSQKIMATLSTTGTAGAAVIDTEHLTGSLTDTADIIAKFTGQGVADNDIVQRGMIIEFIG